MAERILIRGMNGLGDCVYQRGVVKAVRELGYTVFLVTSWPQVYHDLDVRFVYPNTNLRTQSENVRAWKDWSAPHAVTKVFGIEYNPDHFKKGICLPRAMLEKSPVALNAKLDFSFEPSEAAKHALSQLARFPQGKKIGLLHPPTVRREWKNTARPCKAEYLQAVVDAFPEVYWIEVGWLAAEKEELYGPPVSGVSRSYMHGELSTDQLLALWWTADVVVSPVGFALPLGLALGTPTVMLYGGDVPDKLLVDKDHDRSKYWALEPDPFCMCVGERRKHDCNKELNLNSVCAAVGEALMAR